MSLSIGSQSNEMSIPSHFDGTPIGDILKKYPDKALATKFINYVLKMSSSEEFKELCTWADSNDRMLEELSKRNFSYDNDRIAFETIADLMLNALSLKKELQNRYPGHKVEYNKNYKLVDNLNPTRHWFVIDGQDGKDFDVAHKAKQK